MSEKITLSREQVEKCLRDALIIRFSTDSHVEALRAALSNQSAPADKGQGEPVAWAMKPGLDRISVNPKASHAVFGHSGVPGWDVPLYAEPPAPVAVMMPEFEPAFEAWWESDGQYCRAGGGDYEKTFAYRAYENALAEIARLNPIKQ